MDIDFEFAELPRLRHIVSALRARRLDFVVDESIVVSTDGDFTWERRDIGELEDALREMEVTLARSQCVAFKMAWPNGRGGNFLLMPESRAISFTPDAGTLRYGSEPCSVGLGWYLDELGETFRPLHPTEMSAGNRE